ncbi:MAG TPA: secretin N-terminal domain-containing protein [Chthoniobacterales bacterium]|nr:secretin N-terminal domain-containing protein [Chthoniobacterales bacterium]
MPSSEEAPVVAPPPPPAAANTTPLQDKTVVLQYPNSDVADVLHLYETLTNKKLVMDNFVQGKVTIFISKPVPRDEAIKIIEMNLLMNGYSLVPAEGDIVKVVGTGKNPRGAGVPIISDDADIPAGDHVISFLFKLRYADPIELQQVLGQYLSPPQTYTSFLALPKSSSILVTENSSVIRSLVHIIDQVDIPPAEVVSEFIKLTRADATKVVEMLKDVFEKGTTAQQPGAPPGVVPGVRPVRVPANVPPQVQVEGDIGSLVGLSEDSIVVGKIKISADVRTNRIHVITRPINMPFVRKLIAEFDANVEFGKPVTRPLRYISAAEVLPVLVQALTEPGTDKQGGADTGGNPNAGPQQQPRRNTSSGSGFDGGSSGSSGGSQNFSEELSTQAVDTTPKAVTIGNAKIIADQRANAIIVIGNREVVVKVSKILDEMDVKAPQVVLSTVIGELSLNNDQQFGIDYFQKFKHVPTNSVQGGFAGISRNPIATGNNTLVDPGSLINFQNLANAAATGGTNVFLSTGFGLSAIVKMLDSTGRFKVINRPVVFTSNNKKAIIASGQEIPVPVSTLSTIVGNSGVGITPAPNNFGTQSSIQYKKVALQLEVVPLINSEKEVTLDILQKVDSLGADPAVIDGNSIPTIATRYIKTTVSAPNGSTVVLGGLITDNKRTTKSGIPVLDRIPIIGALFRSTRRNNDRTELIILMRPEVALTKLDLYRLRQKTEERTHFGPDLDQDDCPDCPKPGDGKQLELPAPDLPGMK